MAGVRFAFGPFVFDPGRATLVREALPVGVGHRGLALLHALLRAQGRTVTKADLLDAGWPGSVVEESNLSVQVAALRKVLGTAPDGTEWIVTVPRVGYRFAGHARIEAIQPSATLPMEGDDAPEKPAIVVVPFANLSGDPGQEYFADGITEDIIAALARFRWFGVVGRNASFRFKGAPADPRHLARELGVRYVLEGSVRKSTRQVRITAQLTEAGGARQIWAEHYDAVLEDIFAVQDRIAGQVAGAIEPELLRTEASLAAHRRRAGNVNALDLVYHGAWFFHRVSRETHLRARDLFRQARDLDPQLAEAASWLARVNAGIVAYGWSDDQAGDVAQGTAAALDAVEMDEKNPYAHYGLAIVSVYAERFESATRAADKAIELSPAFALGHLVLGMARLFSGDAAGALAPLERGLALNPYDPQNFVWYATLALARLLAGDPRRALDEAVRALKVRPQWRPALETLACCHAALGDRAAAATAWRNAQTAEAAPRDVFTPLRRHNAPWAARLAALLKEAAVG